MKKYYVVVKTSVVGYHRYENAPDCVAFLRNKHRHLFLIKTRVEVEHNNRSVEFYTLQRDVIKILHSCFKKTQHDEIDFENKSCEQIGEVVGGNLRKMGYNVVEISVSEDGENTGVVGWC